MKTGRVRFLLSFATAMLALTASGACVAQIQKDREFQECPECPVMVGIPAGTFVMGSPHTENGRFDSEGPQHEVAIKAFALGKYDVTSEQFLTFLRETGYQPQACSSMRVSSREMANFRDCVAKCPDVALVVARNLLTLSS